MENGFSRRGFSRSTVIVSIIGLFLALFALSALPAYSATRIQANVQRRPGELVVKLKDSKSLLQSQAFLTSTLTKALGSANILSVKPFQTSGELHLVKIAKDQDLQKAIAALESQPGVAYAEPNYVYHAFGDDLPNDADFAKLWGLKNTGQADSAGQVGHAGSDIGVVPVWNEGYHGSRKVVVAVIDTGADWTHPDLAANIYTNEAEDKGAAGKDDDGNGFVDDVHGWDFANSKANAMDDHNHGSHCSGTIGGVGNNGQGVAGVNWEVTILPVKFLDSGGSGSLANAVEAINYATKMHVNIMSNSWGGGGFSQALQDAIQGARDAGILFVAAAGNNASDNDATPSYPASYPLDNVLAVAAVDNQDRIASFSNYGAKTVQVAAPGVNIYSTVKGGGYEVMSGTSMATPHVSGAAALLLSANPSWTYKDLKQRLIETSDPVPGLKKKVLAHGRINVYNALHDIIPPSNEPDPSLWKPMPKSLESAHPYKENANDAVTVQVPGAKYLRVHFTKVELEANYDFVSIESGSGQVADSITGTASDYTSEYVEGDTVVVRLKSDYSNDAFGYSVDRIDVIQ